MSTTDTSNNPAYWDTESQSFDDAIDHGLKTPAAYQAWKELLQKYVPRSASRILDVGCGTGSLSFLLEDMGHGVTGVDFSSSMIAVANNKAKRKKSKVTFQVMDARNLDFLEGSFDILLSRHLLWMFEDRVKVLGEWKKLLSEDGKLILIEGYWWSNAGIQMQTLRQEVSSLFHIENATSLSKNDRLWGKKVTDERYIMVASKQKA